MLKKFSEFIAEGMWGSALRRSNTNELRKEEIVHLDIPISVSDIIEMYPELSKHLKTSQYSW